MVLFPTHQANNNIVHIYAPMKEADNQLKEEFYMRLQDVLDKRNKHDLLIVTGDMNDKVGEENWDYDKVMGKHGLGRRNDGGEGLCELCDTNELSYHRNTLPT